jgi:hypothetical protein
MIMDPAALRTGMDAATGGVRRQDRGPDIGACFQLALIAAAEGNDQEAATYLRQIIAAMKAMAVPGA